MIRRRLVPLVPTGREGDIVTERANDRLVTEKGDVLKLETAKTDG